MATECMSCCVFLFTDFFRHTHDVRELEAHGLDVIGWDPNFYPDSDPQLSDITNLGFVLNVIEERKERDETLRRAWGLL